MAILSSEQRLQLLRTELSEARAAVRQAGNMVLACGVAVVIVMVLGGGKMLWIVPCALGFLLFVILPLLKTEQVLRQQHIKLSHILLDSDADETMVFSHYHQALNSINQEQEKTQNLVSGVLSMGFFIVVLGLLIAYFTTKNPMILQHIR